MKTFFKILIGIVIFIATLGLIGSGVIYAYGHYGVPLVREKIETVETNLENKLETQYPGTTADVEILETFYKSGDGIINIVFKIHGEVVVFGVTQEETTYASIDIFALILGAEDMITTHDEVEWNDELADKYQAAPEILFEEKIAKNTGIIAGSISLGVIVLSILIRVLFLRKKRS